MRSLTLASIPSVAGVLSRMTQWFFCCRRRRLSVRRISGCTLIVLRTRIAAMRSDMLIHLHLRLRRLPFTKANLFLVLGVDFRGDEPVERIDTGVDKVQRGAAHAKCLAPDITDARETQNLPNL